jgi:scyllo-inositol 2-dehydrogenase (NADP+)
VTIATSDARSFRVALVGYGLSGSVFHGPLIAATPGLTVHTIVTGDVARRAQAERDFPEARVVAGADEVWAHPDHHELVVVATTTGTHVPLASAAIDAGLDVVVEKPLAPSSAPARALVERARAAGVTLTVFHNRRWDADYLTLRRLVDEGALGEVYRLESRFERWRPQRAPGAWREELPADDGGGVLLDLGVHLVDQARSLLGPVTHVYGEIAARRGGSDDDVFVALRHAGGARSHLWASAVAAAPGPRLRVLGSVAGYVVEHLDGQEEALRAGHKPDEAGFGQEPPKRWGRLVRGDDEQPVPSEPGRWSAFYAGVLDTLRRGVAPPVDAQDALQTLKVLEAARHSAEQGTLVPL